MGEAAKPGADNFLYQSTTTKKYDIPISHLDYEYINKCYNVKELEKILRVLRSGDEGYFPDLERTCENRITELNPNSRSLRKDKPIMRSGDIEQNEWQEIEQELKGWSSGIKESEERLQQTEDFTNEDDELPPVRACNTMNMKGKQESTDIQPEVSNKRVKPREYREWDKIDVEKELDKIDKEDEEKKQKVPKSTKPTDIQDTINTKGMTDEEKQLKANREKDKGNEAFRAGDHEEAIIYYSRSISLLPTAASYNNRALAYLKVSKWDKALKDCDKVLTMEPDNIKALLRRGSANKGKKEFNKAQIDFERVIELEPSNKRAMDLLDELKKASEKAEAERKQRKEKGKRMVIEEVDGSDEEEEPSPVPSQTGSDKLTETSGNGISEHSVKLQNSKKENINLTNGCDKPLVNGIFDEKNKVHSEKSKDIWEEGEVANNCDSIETANQKSEKEKEEVSDNVVLANQKTESNGNVVVQSDEKKSIEEVKDNQQNEEKEKSQVLSNNQCSEAVVNQNEEEEGSNSEETNENFSLTRPVYIQNELPSDVSVLREEGNNLFKTGQYGDAIQKYSAAINKLQKCKSDQVVNLSIIHSNRAACHSKTGDCPAAIRDCTTALELVPHSVKPLLRRAAAYEVLERYRLAYIDYKHALQIDRNVDMAHQGSSRCQRHLQQDDGPKWREKLPPMKSVSPWEIPEIIDSTKQDTGSTAAASSSVTMATQAPKAPEPSVVAKEPEISSEEKFELKKGEGNKCVQKGDFRMAVKLYSECIELFPDRTVSYTNRALCYLRLNQPSDAEEDCSKALQIEPENVKALFRRGQARKMLKRYKESLEDLTHLLKVDPKNTACKKELDLVKNYYREELISLKKNMPDSKTGSSTIPTKSPSKPETKQRKRMVIQEVESDSEEEDRGKKETIPEKVNEPAKSSSKKTDKTTPTSTSQSTNKHTGHPKSTAKTVKSTSTGLPVAPPSVPKLDKATPYEFIQAWNSLKLAKDVQPYADLLRQISPEDIPKVISNKLDGQMLNTITKCVAQKFVDVGDADTGYKILANLCKVPRFQTIAMFLSKSDKKDIQTVFQQLQTRKSDCYSEADIARLKQEYGIK